MPGCNSSIPIRFVMGMSGGAASYPEHYRSAVSKS